MTKDNPTFMDNQFQCPHCGVVAQQKWFNEAEASSTINSIIRHIYFDYRVNIRDYQQETLEAFIKKVGQFFSTEYKKAIPPNFAISTCNSCSKIALWIDREIIFPRLILVDRPNEDLSEEIKSLYNEASRIYIDSPKGATALLRLALQLLLKQIGKEGKNINNDIKELVSEGLSPKIQQALDLLRVVGNNAVHPGQINLDDNRDIALKLFHLLNYIANELITKPKELDTLYNEIIPESTRLHINQRDKLTRT
ncbi:MAG: DUF4145 domain-containing protein [Gammaproteobacteria bacterium]|nr:DUF4145 domain-containing protein [Gammaproteobacteria bacterium]MBU1725739.1 DUF4145 domain-containing protein [Gammaproteobacteria bacterium]MBU2003909.1 DUF4145 domain-containing protein [Gammaproteobacteria bacterium]